MIEFALINNGPCDVPIKKLPSGTTVPAVDLKAMHESRQRSVIDQVRQAVLAEELGFHYYFFTEHHFQPEGVEFSPNPLLLDAAIATCTKRIRLGQMANILPWWHPIRLAEQAAMVDIISGGRLEFGIGRGVQPRETEVFGQSYGSTVQDDERNRAFFEECYEIILKAWTEPSFSYHGQFFTIPPNWTNHHHPQTIEYFSQPHIGRTLDQVLSLGEPTNKAAPISSHSTILKEMQIYPQPLQKPHPQIWQPVLSPRSMYWAARRGINGIFAGSGIDKVRSDVETYYKEAEKNNFPDYLNRGKFKYGWDCEKKRGLAHLRFIHMVDHGIGNLERARIGTEHFWGYLGAYGPADPRLGNQSIAEHLDDVALNFFGSAQQIIDGFMKLREVGRNEDFLAYIGIDFPGIRGEETEEQMHAFAEYVMPVLKRECGGSPELKTAQNGGIRSAA